MSEAKGMRKAPVASAAFRAGSGIDGDAHAGPWHRQVSILAAEEIAQVRAGVAAAGLPGLKPGDFAENVIVAGIDLLALGLGSRLRLGSLVVLAITQIGKECHNPCNIQELTGDCIMPRAGLFARVEAGGEVRAGDAAEVIHVVPRQAFQAVVLTISDRCSRGEATDTAGPAIVSRLEELGMHVYTSQVLPDEQSMIADRLRHYSGGHSIDLILTVGGTGFSPRDLTPEATRAVVERLAPGLDEAMRAASAARTRHAMLSRGVSGIRGSTLIVNLPGSARAAVENLGVIEPALPHALQKVRGDQTDCGRPGKK